MNIILIKYIGYGIAGFFFGIATRSFFYKR